MIHLRAVWNTRGIYVKKKLWLKLSALNLNDLFYGNRCEEQHTPSNRSSGPTLTYKLTTCKPSWCFCTDERHYMFYISFDFVKMYIFFRDIFNLCTTLRKSQKLFTGRAISLNQPCTSSVREVCSIPFSHVYFCCH